MNESLPDALRLWAARQAEAMGLPGPEDYIVLLLRLEKQRQDLEGIEERYRHVFFPDRSRCEGDVLNQDSSETRQSGQLKGKTWIAEDFDAPDPEIEQLFAGEEP